MKLIKIFGFFAVLILAIIIIEKCNRKEKITMVGMEFPFDMPWKKPTVNESLTFNKLIGKFEDENCLEMFSKEIYQDAFIVACLKESKKWDYFYCEPKSFKIEILSEEIKSEISAPK